MLWGHVRGAPAPGFKTVGRRDCFSGTGRGPCQLQGRGHKLPTSLFSGQWDWNRVDETGIVTKPLGVSSTGGPEGHDQVRPHSPASPERTSASAPGAAHLAMGTALVQVLARSAQLGVRQNLAWVPGQPLRKLSAFSSARRQWSQAGGES